MLLPRTATTVAAHHHGQLRRQRKPQPDTGAAPGRRLDNKLAATPPGTLLHDGHAEVVRAAGRFLGKALAIIADFNLYVASHPFDLNSYRSRLGMAPHVRQRLAHDVQRLGLGSRFRVALIEYK